MKLNDLEVSARRIREIDADLKGISDVIEGRNLMISFGSTGNSKAVLMVDRFGIEVPWGIVELCYKNHREILLTERAGLVKMLNITE